MNVNFTFVSTHAQIPLSSVLASKNYYQSASRAKLLKEMCRAVLVRGVTYGEGVWLGESPEGQAEKSGGPHSDLRFPIPGIDLLRLYHIRMCVCVCHVSKRPPLLKVRKS